MLESFVIPEFENKTTYEVCINKKQLNYQWYLSVLVFQSVNMTENNYQ